MYTQKQPNERSDKFANKIKNCFILYAIRKHNYIEQEEVGLFCLKPKNRFLKNTWTLYARAELQINFTHDKKKVNAIDKMLFFSRKTSAK